jgi:hypothetical protein
MSVLGRSCAKQALRCIGEPQLMLLSEEMTCLWTQQLVRGIAPSRQQHEDKLCRKRETHLQKRNTEAGHVTTRKSDRRWMGSYRYLDTQNSPEYSRIWALLPHGGGECLQLPNLSLKMYSLIDRTKSLRIHRPS